MANHNYKAETFAKEIKMTAKEYRAYLKQKFICWGELKDIAEEYAQKYMHPHMVIIITPKGIEEFDEGFNHAKFEMPDGESNHCDD